MLFWPILKEWKFNFVKMGFLKLSKMVLLIFGVFVSTFQWFQLMLYNILVLGLDVLRVWIGPLPPWLCTSYIVLKGFLYNSFTLVLFTLTVMKYVFLCILKRVPEMNDELVTRIVIGGVCIWSALELCAKFLMFPGKPVVNEVSLILSIFKKFLVNLWKSDFFLLFN